MSYHTDNQYGDGGQQGEYEGRQGRAYSRKPRPVTDYGSSMVQWIRNRGPRHKGFPKVEVERPSASYIVDMLPPPARLDSPADTIPVRHLHTSVGKAKKPITVVRWTPEGRRLIAGMQNGEFMLWNGMQFNFETVWNFSTYSPAVRAAIWSHNHEWMISSDQTGMVRVWQPNFNNVAAIQAHDAEVRGLAFSPTDVKYVTASDDNSLKIFDFASNTYETTLQGHTWEVRCCDWHPTKGLIVSGSKDKWVKLWDPRTSNCLTTLRNHKHSVAAVSFSPVRDNLLASAGQDQNPRILDLRMMRDVCFLRGHQAGVRALSWHPIHSSLLSTGDQDGALHHYLLDEPNTPSGVPLTISPYDSPDPSNTPAQTIYPAHRIAHAHDKDIWSLDWHPLGHILASGGNDQLVRFWSRARPGETEYVRDVYHLGKEGAEAQGTWNRQYGQRKAHEEEEEEFQDEAEGLVDQIMPAQNTVLPGIPGLPIPVNAVNSPKTGGAQSLIPGMDSAAPQPNANGLPGPSGTPMDPSRLAALFASGSIPPPPIPAAGTGQPGFVPPPPPGFDFSKIQFPPGFQFPQGFPPPPPQQGPPANGAGGGIPGLGGGGGDAAGGSVRRRAPLPSQQESLMAEQRRGNWRNAR